MVKAGHSSHKFILDEDGSLVQARLHYFRSHNSIINLFLWIIDSFLWTVRLNVVENQLLNKDGRMLF